MENIAILGAGGFIGTNLSLRLAQRKDINLTLVDRKEEYFNNIWNGLSSDQKKGIRLLEESFQGNSSFEHIIRDKDVIYHLISSTNPTIANRDISTEFTQNVIMTNNLLESCVKNKVKKVVFLSSGGTVYGTSDEVPLKECSPTFPINSYGIQKITIEKLLYFYNYTYGLDYRIIRLSNPYGPYQKPDGIQGVVTTFVYKALRNDPIIVYGDGSVIRDYIYIDDAVDGIINIAESENGFRLYNLGTAKGYSINELINVIKHSLGIDVEIRYTGSRKVDVPVNILNIDRYKSLVKDYKFLDLKEGIIKTADFLKNRYFL